MDPNLLPQNLRGKEDRERGKIKHQSRGFEIELSKPIKKTDSAKSNWWQSLTGVSVNKPATVSATLTEPLMDNPQDYHMNWLEQGSDLKNRKAKPEKVKKTSNKKGKSGWLKSLLGKPVSPILTIKEIELPIPVKPMIIEKKLEVKPQIKVKKPSDGWGSIVGDMFGFSKVKSQKLKFASVEEKLAVPVKAPISEAPAKVVLSKKKGKETEKKSIKSPYNLVPKHEKMAVDVNLMPKESVTEKTWSAAGSSTFIIVAVISILLVTAGYFSIVYLQKNLEQKMSLQQVELNDLNRQIGDFVTKEKENNHVAQKVTAIKKLMMDKIIWSSFFKLLEKYTLDGVYFTSLSADTSGVLVLPGVANDYSVLAKQLAVFRDAVEFVKDVKISNAQLYSEGKAGVVGSSFQIRLVLQDGIFSKIK
jgi:Tfp pilus assembly protein PilN